MATHTDFKKLALERLKTVDVLMSVGEWWVAAYMLGFVLECVLKAGACKALCLEIYPAPQTTKEKKITSYFLTHDFDMLLVISGASDIFGLSGSAAATWSGFMQEYQESYTRIRYDLKSQYDEAKVKRIYSFLTREPDGIIPLMENKNKW